MVPLVLLPGLGSDNGLWAAQTRDLADIAACTIGDTLQDGDLPAMAARILAAAPERFALAGLSMGGYLALEMVRQAPGRIERLALLDTSARADTSEQTAGRHAAIAASERYDYAMLSRKSVAQLVHTDATEAVRDTVVAMAIRVGPEVYRRQQRAVMARPDSRPLLARIAVPTMVLVGAQDALTPPALAQEMHAGIAGSTLVMVADAGHLPPVERADAVTAALRGWLR